MFYGNMSWGESIHYIVPDDDTDFKLKAQIQPRGEKNKLKAVKEKYLTLSLLIEVKMMNGTD